MSCDGEGRQAARAREVELHFDAKIGAQRVQCGEALPGVGTNERVVTLKDLRFFVHDVQLIDAKGAKVELELPDDGLWQAKNVALLDFANTRGDCSNGSEATNAIVRGNAPAGDYRGVSFRIGVPSAISHGNTGEYPAPLSSTSLYWDWLQGYIFFKLDLQLPRSGDDQAGGFQVHLGANRCTNDDGKFSCARENVPSVELSTFDLERDKVVLDLGALLQNVSVTSQPDENGGLLGCAAGMNDPDCARIYPAFGLDVDSGEPATPQTAFSAQPREADDPGRSREGDGAVLEESDAGLGHPSYTVELPKNRGFAPPLVPADNPLSKVKIELGRRLFYDPRLSGNETQSCASCHKQELAFTDGRAVGLGSTGESHRLGAMSLANIAYSATLTWADPTTKLLEAQAMTPMFGEKPVELGMRGREAELLARLRDEPVYRQLFPAAFPGERDPFTVASVTRAIASFERILISGNSPYDRYISGEDPSALSESAKRGMALFFDPDPGGSAFECFHCHGGVTFSDQVTHANQPSGEEPFHNTGLYNLGVYGAYPTGNQGLFERTGIDNDRGRFKAPTLRNIAVTAPYMHDGSIATLEEVVAHYARGGRNVESGPNLGDGKLNRNKSEFIHGFNATPEQRADLIEFLKSLTDEEFLTNPAFADPWQP